MISKMLLIFIKYVKLSTTMTRRSLKFSGFELQGSIRFTDMESHRSTSLTHMCISLSKWWVDLPKNVLQQRAPKLKAVAHIK